MKLKIENDSTSNLMDTQELSSDVHSANGSAEVTEMLRNGIKAAQEGNRSEARHLLMQATELEPNNENAWLWLASISEYPEELLIFLNNVLKINSKNERALEWEKSTKTLLSKTFVQRGIEASKESQTAFAKQCFMQAIVNDDKNEMAWLWLASISESVDDKKSHLQKVLKINPENESAKALLESVKAGMAKELLQKAQNEALAGETESAKKSVAELLKTSPDIEEGWLLKCYLTDSFTKKMDYLEKVLEINSENQNAVLAISAMKSVLEFTVPSFDSAEPNETESAAFESVESHEAVDETELNLVEIAETDEDVEETMFAAVESVESFGDVSEAELNEVASEENYEGVFEVPVQLTPQEVADFPTQDYNFHENSVEGTESIEEQELNSPQQIESVEEIVELEAETSEASFVEEPTMDQPVQESEEYTFEDMESDFSEVEEESRESVMSSEIPSYQELIEEAESFEEEQEVAQTASAAAEEEEIVQSSFEAPEFVAEVPGEDADDQEREFAETDTPVLEMPEAPFEVNHTASEKPVFVMVSCAFCNSENDQHDFICHSCRAMLTMSDLDMMIAYPDADLEVLRPKVEQMQQEYDQHGLEVEDLKTLGIGLLNIKDLRSGFEILQEASRLDPNDVVLASHVNTLAIRLSEIEDQKSNHESIPRNKSILVVDDSATVRKLVSGKLEKCGLDVICAVDGMDALEKINESIPDLILLDITMPRMDGYQVCKLIRGNEATKDVPVVMISGKDGFFDKVRGRMAGTTGYITKPFGPETLMKTVESYID